MSAQNNNYFLSEWFTFNYRLNEQGVQQIFIIIRAHNYSQNPRTGQVQYFECVKLENVWYSSHDGRNSDGHKTLNIKNQHVWYLDESRFWVYGLWIITVSQVQFLLCKIQGCLKLTEWVHFHFIAFISQFWHFNHFFFGI